MQPKIIRIINQVKKLTNAQREAVVRAAFAKRDELLVDCEGGMPCTTCADRKKCYTGCLRQLESVSGALDAIKPLPADSVASELEEMRQRKDDAYFERNQIVAALAKCFPSGIAKTAIEGWSEDWHGCVYINLPTGQVSWHFHESQAHLFAALQPYIGSWDGHDTPEKYRRLAAMTCNATPGCGGLSNRY